MRKLSLISFVLSLVLGLAVCDLLAQEPVDKGEWVEGMQETDDGATRDYYNRAARLEWANYS